MISKKHASKIRQILNRRVPYTLVSWRFFLPGQSDAVKLHRRVMLYALKKHPCIFWIPVYFFTWLFWMLIFGWMGLFKILKKQSGKLKAAQGISIIRQGIDLIELIFFHGIPPHFYYQFNLFQADKKDWFNYVFTHELPFWHLAFNQMQKTPSHQIISDKYQFSQTMKAAGIPAIPTLTMLPGNTRIEAQDIFRKQSVFFKPITGNQSEGCFELRYNAKQNVYTLPQSEVNFENQKALYKDILKRMTQKDMLVQPLLLNHRDVEALCLTEKLVTLRIITARDGRDRRCISAVAEIPLKNEKFWYIIQIDTETGKLMPGKRYRAADTAFKYETQFAHLEDAVWPFWQDCKKMCLQAHKQLPGLLTVGWDAAVAQNGPLLVEGNSNWGVTTAQCLNSTPLLETPLKNIYLTSI